MKKKRPIKNPKQKKTRKKWENIILYTLIPFLMLGCLMFLNTNDKPKEISYQTFNKMVKQKEIKSITIDKNSERLTVLDKNKKKYHTESPTYEGFKKELMEKGIKVSTNTTSWFSIVNSIFGLLIYVALFYIIYRSLNGRSSSKLQTPATIPSTKFNDIAGYSEQKHDLETYVEYLKNPKQFNAKGAKMPKGVLLYGPPGTGKTLFARAIAGEAGVPFFSVSGSDFIEMFVGLGAKRIRKLFATAREKGPCIIFIDEIDAIGGQRSATQNSEQTQTINALLSEMDGFNQDTGILVLATTNRLGNLDNALTRSGRFDNHISIPLPATKEDRLKIIEVHKKNREFDDDVNFEDFAKEWIGFSGADIESLLNEASIVAIQKGLPKITKECINESFYKKILKGHIKRNGQALRSREELKLVAYHEAGHAIARRLLNKGEVSKVTILSTTSGAGGVTFNIPEKAGLFSMDDLESEVQILYAGRAAEYLLFDKDIRKVTTGAGNDIERATSIIKEMVMECGLQRDPLLINFKELPKMNDYAFDEIKAVSKRLFNQVVALLEENKMLLDLVANELLDKETIESVELEQIISNYLEIKKDNVA